MKVMSPLSATIKGRVGSAVCSKRTVSAALLDDGGVDACARRVYRVSYAGRAARRIRGAIMAGRAQDTAKRNMLRVVLASDEFKDASDRDIATAMGCSKGLVGAVRRQMIAAGEIKPPTGLKHVYFEVYKAGQSARGGYVYDANGHVVREDVWKRKQAKIKRQKPTPRPRKAKA